MRIYLGTGLSKVQCTIIWWFIVVYVHFLWLYNLYDGIISVTLVLPLCHEDDNISNITLENTEGAIKNGQSRETGNIGYTRRRQTKQKHNATQYALDTLNANKHK